MARVTFTYLPTIITRIISDSKVLILIADANDPTGTRCRGIGFVNFLRLEDAQVWACFCASPCVAANRVRFYVCMFV